MSFAKYKAISAVVLAVFAAGNLLFAGCASKESGGAAPTNQTASREAAGAEAAGTAKPTPEQEAAKQRGMAQGAAIQAAAAKAARGTK